MRLTFFAVAALSQILAFSAFGAVQENGPAEAPQIAQSRDSASQLTFDASLSRNVYRYEQHQETYTVQVPYTVSVPYLDWETYWVTEYQCTGQGPQREVCVTIGGARICHYEYEKNNSCQYVQVPYTRQVTRYREETRYRTEERTRLVTVKIFVRQWGTRARVIFPTGSEPMGSETETVLLTLSGDETQPDAQVAVDSSVYNYRVVSSTREGGMVIIRLETVSKYSTDDLGLKTIEDLRVSPKANSAGVVLRFDDHGLLGRTRTRYEYTIADSVTGAILYTGKGEGLFGATRVNVSLPDTITMQQDLNLSVKVRRDGVSIEGGVAAFEAKTTQLGLINSKPYIDVRAISGISIEGKGVDSKLLFTDAAPAHDDIRTEYTIALTYRGQRFLFAGRMKQNDYIVKPVAGSPVSIEMSIAQLPNGDGTADLARILSSGAKIGVEISTSRLSARLGDLSPVFFRSAKTIEIR